MKKRILIMVLVVCSVLVFCTACSQATVAGGTSQEAAPSSSVQPAPSAAEPAPSPAMTAAPTAAQSAETQPEASLAEGELKFKGVEFDQASNDYFGGDAAAALQNLSPLLLSASMAEYSVDMPLVPDDPDTSVEWALIYQYSNSYGEENAEVDVLEDGNLAVPQETMEYFFQSFFSFFEGAVPPLNTNFAIQLDESAQSYTIGRSDFGEIAFAVTGFSLSKAGSAADETISATVTMTGYDIDGESKGVIQIEIVPKADTLYGYSVQSIEME